MFKRISRWIAKKLYRITANMPCRLIDVNYSPYLERYYVGKLWGLTFYLHRFVASDGDRELHDHPWRFSASFVLCGGYTEKRLNHMSHRAMDGVEYRIRKVRFGIPNILLAGSFHQIVKIPCETWTLFMHTRPIKRWGFIKKVDEEHIVYYAYQYKQDLKNWHHTAPYGRFVARFPEVL